MAQSTAVSRGAETDSDAHPGKIWALVLASLGVAYGDIGTSPLYALREAVHYSMKSGLSARYAVIGILSLVLWSLFLIVTLKYIIVLLRADNRGEGGTFALMALAQSATTKSTAILSALGIVGASFFYGDAMLTPAISVLSAVEGIELVTPVLKPVVVPVALVILIGLFSLQSHGTERVGRFFGPITLIWFAALAVGGLIHIVDDPGVFLAFNPYNAVEFLAQNGLIGFTIMGLVFLAVTGAESMYADLGHFGRRPLQVAWGIVVLPALVLNYLGQGALVLAHPHAVENPFFLLYPKWALLPMVCLATLATVVASQAVITGTFSVTRQAMQLGLLPRFSIQHTSASVEGQIYLPRVNHLLLFGVIVMVVVFRSSSNLAAAYGVSVSGTMIISSAMAFFVIWRAWKWPLWKALALVLPLITIELAFFVANILKVFEGGWVPLLVGSLLALVMYTWVRGSRVLLRATRKNEAELDWLLRKLEAKPPHRVPGTAVFLTGDPTHAPTSLMHNLKHNRVLHERNIILSIKTEDTPRVPRHERVTTEKLGEDFTLVVARYGFMETPSVPKIFDHCRRKDLNVDFSATSFFLSRRSLKKTIKSEMPGWQERLFIWLARKSEDATEYFQIPTDRVVEVGTQVAV
jgi:KUP system potassium uptake protein